MLHEKLLANFLVWWLFLPCLKAGTENAISLHLATTKTIYAEEEYIFLPLVVENTSAQTQIFSVSYLQPKEKKHLFVGDRFSLHVIAQDQIIPSFTNHMPPEPHPGTLQISLPPGENLTWKIPFPYDFYPVKLPCLFRVFLVWEGIKSNEVCFQVMNSGGKSQPDSLIVNSDFSQGETFPWGWKIEHQTVFWNKQEKMLCFSLDVPTATGEGLWVYSLFRPIQSPGTYTLQLTARSQGPEIIVFVEGWGLVGERRRRLERNECFAHPPNQDWKDYNFQVVFTKPEVKWFRIRLFTYGQAGSVWFKRLILNQQGKTE